MIATGISRSRTLFVGEERFSVVFFGSFVEQRPLLTHPCDGLFFSTSVSLSSKRSRKFKHLVQTKPMGENTITNIMRVSVPSTSLKESAKKSLRIIAREKQQPGS